MQRVLVDPVVSPEGPCTVMCAVVSSERIGVVASEEEAVVAEARGAT